MPLETVHDVVAEARASFALGTRADGSEFWHRTDDAPEWVSDMVYAAHADMLPDDFRYRFIVEALNALAEALGEDGNADDALAHFPEIIYTSEVTSWAASRNDRLDYADEAAREYGGAPDWRMFDRLAAGMDYERSEVLASVMSSIEDRAASLGIEG